MQAISSRLITAALCFLLVSCGGTKVNSTSDAPVGDGSGVLSGYLLAPRTTGLVVGNSITRDDGGFSYNSGQSLSFALDSLTISSLKARPRLSLYDLVGSAEQYRFDKTSRLTRLLISLDSDGDARNGVQLSNIQIGANELDWQTSDSIWSAAAESLLYRVSGGNQQLISQDAALQAMASQFRAETELCAENLSSNISASSGFSIADPSCADRVRMALWQEISDAQLNLQSSLDNLFASQLGVREWWAVLQSDWQNLFQRADETQAWLSYALAGADVPTRQAISDALAAGGSFTASLEAELERWRIGGGAAMRHRDLAERELAAKTIQAWLSYGFDQKALHNAYGLTNNGGGEAFVNAVAQREGVSTTLVRTAVVDQQVYLALQLIDALMNSQDDWVTSGSNPLGGLSDDGGGGGNTGQTNDPARVWRVSYNEITIGTLVEFTIEGSALDADVSLVLADCNNMQALSGSASSIRFSCDMSGVAGGRTLQVIDSSDGSLLYEAIVSAVGLPSNGGLAPIVSSVSPVSAQRSSSQLFRVFGQNFPTDLQFRLEGCLSPQVQQRSSTQLQMLCQLDDRAMVRTGGIESADGSEIYSFTVSATAIDEQQIRVFDLAPAAALEAQTLDMVITGSGFGNAVEVQSSGCESISLLTSSDAEIRFNCYNAKLGNWPVNVVSAQQNVLAPRSFQVRGLEATVTAVSPLQGAEGEWVNLKVSGQYLGAGVELELDACSVIETLDSTAVLRQFGCTLGTAGLYQGQVLAADKVLYSFDFTVEPKTASHYINVSPKSSPYGEPLELRVTGVDLPERAKLELEGCANIALLSVSPSEMVYTCTPQQAGVLSGKLVDSQARDLLSFSVDIVDGRNLLEDVVIGSVFPAATYLDAQTTFTVRGELLPTSMVVSVEGCTTVVPLGGTDRQRQFRCTPRGASGEREIQIYASEGGVLLGSFDLQVTGSELRVSALTPSETALGVQTDFRVSGQNLSSAVVLVIEGCDARLQPSSSSEQRIYRCAPYGLPGQRTAKVLDRVGGSVLYTHTINFLAAT